MWTNGMLDMRNQLITGVSDVADLESDVDDIEWFGFDPYAPTPDDEGLSTVEVDDVDMNIQDHILDQLRYNINPLSNSDSFGIDLYENALSLLLDAGVVIDG
jgi:hypothetical protein